MIAISNSLILLLIIIVIIQYWYDTSDARNTSNTENGNVTNDDVHLRVLAGHRRGDDTNITLMILLVIMLIMILMQHSVRMILT